VRTSTLEGLWIVLVPDDDHGARLVPMLARAGNSLYLLAFRTGFTARKFITDRAVAGAEPRMVMRALLPSVAGYLARKRVASLLIDYDATANTYRGVGLVT